MNYFILLFSMLVSLSVFASPAQEEQKKERRGLFGWRKKREIAQTDTVFQTVVVRDTVYLKNSFDSEPVFANFIDDTIPEEFTDKLDYLTKAWTLARTDERTSVEEATEFFKKNPVVECSDSVYLERLDALKSAVPLSYNSIVKRYIELYTKRGRMQTARMLGLGEFYFPMFEEALDRHNMPLELKYMAVIESALNPTAFSKAGACGLWQFMYATGRMYKLEINSYIDERRDPIKSTEAAVTYLKDLYDIYGNWMLVIAAYNCGPGNVNKAIRRSGGYKNYWDVYYHLPRETRGYIPAFIGAMYAFEYHKEHNIIPLRSDLPVLADSLFINDLLHFEQISNKVGVSVDELRRLNPQYRADAIPASDDKEFLLMLPAEYVADFIDNQDSVFAYNRSKYFDMSDRKADPNKRIKVHGSSIAGGGDRIIYTVKSGDVPGGIASRYKVRLADMRAWNNLNSRYTIRPGQKLVLYVSPTVAKKYKGASSSSGSTPVAYEKLKEGEYFYYTMQRGDNLWQISKRFPGVSDKDIMKWNNIQPNQLRDLKPGVKLKIKKS